MKGGGEDREEKEGKGEKKTKKGCGEGGREKTKRGVRLEGEHGGKKRIKGEGMGKEGSTGGREGWGG